MKFSLGRPRRSVPSPEAEPRHQSQNPLFQTEDIGDWRQRVLGWTVLCLVLGGVLWWVYGPANRITTITVRGTVFVSADSVHEVAEYYTGRWRWLILWQQQAPLIQTGALANSIQRKIAERVAVKRVIVEVQGRHELVVTVQERVPVAIWVSGKDTGWLDDSGTIVQRGAPPTGLELFSVRDESGKSFRPSEQVLTAGVVSSLQTLNDALKSAALTVEEIRLPLITCLELPEVLPTNGNVNAANTNTTRQTNANSNSNAHTNISVVNGSANTNTALPCDPDDLRQSRPEIDLVLQDGPLVKFDRYTDLRRAVSILKTLLAEQKNSGATVIDLRFGDRVYIR